MEASQSVTRPFTNSDVVTHLKDTLIERMEASLAREIGTTAQAIQDGEPVPYRLWPREQQSMALWAARFALRLLDRRARRDAHLHATMALARQRYAGAHVRELSTAQLRGCYFDAKIVLDQEWGRMTDLSFRYLEGDTRQRIEQAAQELDSWQS